MVKRTRSKRSLSKSSTKKRSKYSYRDFKKLILDGQTYLLNDTVNIFEESDPDAYARILRIFTLRKDEVYISVRWFYKPKDVFGDSIPSYISQNEIFESDLINEISAVAILKKVSILQVKEYCNLPPSNSQPYFYRARYLVKRGSIEPLLEAQDLTSSEMRYLDSENSMAYYNIYSEDLYKSL
jgi:hypothetical protein